MDELNFFGDDFLSSGEFHQLYSTFDHQDEICLWENRIDFDLQSHSKKWNYANDMSAESNYTDYSSCQVGFINFVHKDVTDTSMANGNVPTQANDEMAHDFFEADNYLTDMDEWKQNHLDELLQQSSNNNEWELNLDNLLLDAPPSESVFNVCDLPARTLYCNDSCTDFLKETSEHLDTSFRTFQPDLAYECVTTQPIMSNEKRVDPTGEEKEFVCTYGDCRKVYAKAGHLKAHIRRHIGDKPYVCHWPNCTWKFSRSDELSRHRRSHSGIKPYHCDLCPKCFSRSDHLTKHRKVHERKMAALKIKAVWTKLPPRKPGRKPKSQLNNFQ